MVPATGPPPGVGSSTSIVAKPRDTGHCGLLEPLYWEAPVPEGFVSEKDGEKLRVVNDFSRPYQSGLLGMIEANPASLNDHIPEEQKSIAGP